MSTLTAGITREKALETLKQYNAEAFHIRHGLTVEAVMGWMAEELGHGEDREFWALAGLLHDVDFEKWPEEHCVKAPELLTAADCTPELVHAVCAHGWGMTGTDCKPEHEMEKVLFAFDELTGLIGAAIVMRPSKSIMDFNVKSLKKKYKDKRFAAGVSREVIASGAEMLGWELDELIGKTILAMRASPNVE